MVKNTKQIDKQREKDKIFMFIALDVSLFSTCSSRKVGSLLVRDNMILSTGYNGTPKAVLNCNDGGCKRCENKEIKSGTRLDECICIHAEVNSVIQAAYNGTSTKDSILYCTNKPCNNCLKLLINAGVKKVIFLNDYNSKIDSQLNKHILITKLK